VEHRATRVWHVSTVQTRVWKRSPMSELRRPDGSLGRFRIGKLFREPVALAARNDGRRSSIKPP
jgi:hypothetical protein